MQIFKKLLKESQWSERCEAERPLGVVVHSRWSKHQGCHKDWSFLEILLTAARFA